MDDALLSSPDPLNDSPTFQSPLKKTRRSSRARQSLPLPGCSPTKQTFELDVGNDISPQKIRVTVEAGNSDTENGYTHFVEGGRPPATSPTQSRVTRRREKTTTTIIPVKGLSDSEDETHEAATPKRGRGRPRKSAGTPVPAKKSARADTPTRRRRSVVNPTDEDNEDDSDFRIGTSVQVGRGRGKGRSRSRSMSKKGRGRRQSLLPDEIVVLQDEGVGGVTESLVSTDMSGALQAVDGNLAYPPSVYSTIRSTTTVGGNEPDVVIARFEPGNETPRRTGWSSPCMMEGQHTSGLMQDLNVYPSPSNSQEKTVSQSAEVQYMEEGEDELGEMPEFDTVLESEGFSMISVDSVPSLREHLSSPVSSEEKESTKAITNKGLSSVKEIEAAVEDDSFSSIPEDVLEAATPARKLLNSNLLSIPDLLIEDSFSSIPPEVLDDATPARKKQTYRLQSRNNSHAEESFSSMAPEILEAATPGKDLPKAKSLNFSDSEACRDSFSAISSPVLEAATPALGGHTLSQQSSVTQTASASNRLSVSDVSRSISSQRNVVNATSNRLPTPEETPSPPPDTSSHQVPGSEKVINQEVTVVSVNQPSTDESSIQSQMRSSPPSLAPRRYTYTAHLRQRRELYPDLIETPSIVFSSPSLPPPIQFARGQPGLSLNPEETQRPALSPIARAGRVLQDIVAPLSSPRARAQSLGSPFKSPIADRKSSSSAAQSSLSPIHGHSLNPLPRVDLAGNLFPYPSQRKQWNRSVHQDDPFSNNAPSHQQSSSPEQSQTYKLELPDQRHLSNPRLSTIRSEADSVRSDDGMSWQAEEEVLATDATTSLVNNINSSAGGRGSSVEASHQNSGTGAEILEQRWAAERAAVRKQIASANPNQVIVIDSDDKNADNIRVEDGDEDFGLLLETLNSSSPVVPQRQEPPKENVEKPRRSKIPSPWRKNSKRLVYSDELSHLSSPPVPGRVSLTKDFAQNNFTEDNALDLSLYQIPQKENFKPRIRESGNLDLSALLASSPSKSHLPVLTKSSQSNTSLPQGPSFTNVSKFRTESTRGCQPFEPIPQKQGFNPRIRDTGNFETSSVLTSSPVKQVNSYMSNFLGQYANKEAVANNPTPELSSSSAIQPLGASSPSRTNTLRIQTAQTPSAELVDSDHSYDSSLSMTSQEKNENQSIDKRTLKWTETVRLASIPMQPFISPTKSILRSPLKTPSNNSGTGSNTSPPKNVAFVSSSPLPSSPTSEPLSSTTWSRDHWVLLDSILQAWKPENNDGSEDGPKGRRRNSTRVISRLLGKRVFSEGQKMKLQQWHLEVVDEFRGIVPGWEEAVIAKRVFALIVGEERRAMGLVGGNQGEEVSYC